MKIDKMFLDIGLSPKKEKAKLIIVNCVLIFAGAITYFFLKHWIVIAISFGLLSIFNFYLFNSYSAKKERLLKERNEEFISNLTFFQSFISVGLNVYNSFSKLKEFSSPWMQEKLSLFLESVDNDKSIHPYIDFSNNFTMGSVKTVMLSIYQMIDEGQNSLQLNQFMYLFQSLKETQLVELKDKHKSSLSNLTVFPLIGAGFIVVILAISIISGVGDLINVI